MARLDLAPPPRRQVVHLTDRPWAPPRRAPRPSKGDCAKSKAPAEKESKSNFPWDPKHQNKSTRVPLDREHGVGAAGRGVPSPSIDRGEGRGDDEELRERRAKRSSIHPSIHPFSIPHLIMEVEYGESVAWREWASRSVGENKVVNSMLIVEKPSQGTANSPHKAGRQDASVGQARDLGYQGERAKGSRSCCAPESNR